MAKNKEFEKAFMTYQMLQKQLEIFRLQAVQLEKEFIEVEKTKQAIEGFSKMKKDNEIMIPLGNGYFAEGSISNLKKVLVGLGNSVMLEKEIKPVHENLENKIKEIEKMSKDLQEKIIEVTNKINDLAPDLEKMIAQAQKK